MTVEHRAGDPVAIAAVAQLAMELVHQIAAVGEDQDAAGARRFDEAERRDRLARAGGVLEPEALGGVRVLGLLVQLALRLVLLVLPVLRLLVLGALVLVLRALVVVLVLVEVAKIRVVLIDDRLERSALDAGLDVLGHDPIGSRAVGALALGQQRGEGARQGIDLMGGEHRAVHQVRLLLGEQALQAQQQGELAPPGDRRRRVPGVDLRDSRVQRTPPRGPWRQGLLERLTVIDEAFARQ